VARARFARAADRDLDEILDYLRAVSPEAARRVASAIQAKIDQLERFPQLGQLVTERSTAEYRRTVAGNYVIWYLVASRSDIVVVGIRHGSRRPPDLAELERRSGRFADQ
jgi:plasmid stabilization system protein ParE